MKNLFFGIIAMLLFSNNVISQEMTYKGEGKNSIVEASNIKSEANTIITEVKITDKKLNVTLPSFFYKFTSDTSDDVRKELTQNPKSVSGTLTIEVDGELLYKVKVINGQFQKAEVFQFVGTSVLGKKYPCTIAGNFECAVDRINAMNWFDYGVCLATAPECLAQTHISCYVDNC